MKSNTPFPNKYARKSRFYKNSDPGTASDNKSASIIGFLSGFFASFCCTIPLALVFLGLASSSFVLAFAEYRWHFIAFSIAYMIAALYVFLQNRKACTMHGIKQYRNLIAFVLITYAAVYVILVFVIVPLAAPLAFQESGTRIVYIEGKTDLRMASIRIDGIWCANCYYATKARLSGLEGVTKVESYGSTWNITYDDKVTSTKSILSSIPSSYKTSIISDFRIR
ncbi:MAG: heavy-metal-associated domain-containing protein [Candidatus Aenigmarchaeota archaeon]|nr:heavy-metal-associated domain-containing protein [Candidatus Aenigmarchaeota archaeon]